MPSHTKKKKAAKKKADKKKARSGNVNQNKGLKALEDAMKGVHGNKGR